MVLKRIFAKVPFLLWLLAAAGLLVPVSIYFSQRGTPATANAPQARQDRFPTTHRCEIQGFRFDGAVAGKPVVTITADHFSLQKQKIGFFRFGLLDVAMFENAVIDFFGDAVNPSPKAPPENVSAPSVLQPVGFDQAFSTKGLGALPVQKAAAVKLAPVTLRLWAGGQGHHKHSRGPRGSGPAQPLGNVPRPGGGNIRRERVDHGNLDAIPKAWCFPDLRRVPIDRRSKDFPGNRRGF